MAKIHHYDENMAPDADFTPGELGLLRPGNACRRLDPRRTPGVIEEYFPDCAMFRWRITAFEHEGRFWDLPAEEVCNYQFVKGSGRLEEAAVRTIEDAVAGFQVPLEIAPQKESRRKTEADLLGAEAAARVWLERESAFFEAGGTLDLGLRRGPAGHAGGKFVSGLRTGPTALAGDCSNYMDSLGMGEMEWRTAENIVLNPSSGEWVKGMEIVLAEMGMVGYKGKVPRTRDIFDGPGSRRNRIAYLVGRLSFVRAFFKVLGIDEVVVYRGMSMAGQRPKPAGALTSYTFSLRVARSFCDFDRRGRSRESLLLKRTVPVKRLFMTYLETAAMNEEYKEAEAMVLSG